MEVNDNAGNLTPHGALRFFASKLAPTGTGFGLELLLQKQLFLYAQFAETHFYIYS
jgi:hypothetical protein